MSSSARETESEATFRRGAYGQGPRALAKVVERVTSRLEQRLEEVLGPDSANAIAGKVEKAWRESYGRSLPTAEQVTENRFKYCRSDRRRAPVKRRTETARAKPPVAPPGPPKRRFVLKVATKANRTDDKRRRKRPRAGEVLGAAGQGKTQHDATPPSHGGVGSISDYSAAGGGNADDNEDTPETRTSEGDAGSASSRVPCQTTAAGDMRQRTGNEDGGRATPGDAGAPARSEPPATDACDVQDGNPSTAAAGAAAKEDKETVARGDPPPAHAGETVAETEDSEACADRPPDIAVTANFVGDMKKGSKRHVQPWKLQLEGGIVEDNSGCVFVFRECLCSMRPPWGNERRKMSQQR